MRATAVLLAAQLLDITYASPVGSGQVVLQPPLKDLKTSHPHLSPPSQHASKRLHGRFLHITDLHPDPHFTTLASTSEEDACHRGKGPAGLYGAETTDCDSPFALINATFKWIEENVKDKVDFVIWTGDSARHDNDEKAPRNEDEVLSTNRWIAQKFSDTFKKEHDVKEPLSIPIISTFGNNDILPHNILLSGPNKWLKAYTDIWSKFIPEDQRHGFERGGWYFVEVIPNKLAVFSLNTLFFFSNNAGVDGCTLRSEPGFEHFEWLRIQLQFLRERGMKAILTGHVPPARTNSKELWDETCWQKYTLWLQKYRDVIVGGFYGHMNIDHFMLHDTKQISILGDGEIAAIDEREIMEDDLNIESANDYLEELRESWSDLPNPAVLQEDSNLAIESRKKKKGKKGKKSKKDKLLEKIGGPWGERFHVTNVGPSIVPNYFPTIRIVEYNITGLGNTPLWSEVQMLPKAKANMDGLEEVTEEIRDPEYVDDSKKDDLDLEKEGDEGINIEKKKKKKKPTKPRDPNLIVPSPPTKGAPPGPAYSPQSLTLLGYTQYFANLTHINNLDLVEADADFDEKKWKEGKHKGKKSKETKPHPKPFKFEVEYDTFNDKIFKLKDMTVRSYINLAYRIGQYKPTTGDSIDDIEDLDEISEEHDLECDPCDELDEDDFDEESQDVDAGKHKKKKHRKKKHHRQHEKNKVWLKFIQRAFVGTLNQEALRNFEAPVFVENDKEGADLHDGEL